MKNNSLYAKIGGSMVGIIILSYGIISLIVINPHIEVTVGEVGVFNFTTVDRGTLYIYGVSSDNYSTVFGIDVDDIKVIKWDGTERKPSRVLQEEKVLSDGTILPIGTLQYLNWGYKDKVWANNQLRYVPLRSGVHHFRLIFGSEKKKYIVIDAYNEANIWPPYTYSDGVFKEGNKASWGEAAFERHDGVWLKESDLNFSNGNWPYLITETPNFYHISRLGESLGRPIPKTGKHKFEPDFISWEFEIPKMSLASVRSVLSAKLLKETHLKQFIWIPPSVWDANKIWINPLNDTQLNNAAYPLMVLDPWKVNSSGGDLSWSGVTTNNMSEDKGDGAMKWPGILYDNFDDGTDDLNVTGGDDSGSVVNGKYCVLGGSTGSGYYIYENQEISNAIFYVEMNISADRGAGIIFRHNATHRYAAHAQTAYDKIKYDYIYVGGSGTRGSSTSYPQLNTIYDINVTLYGANSNFWLNTTDSVSTTTLTELSTGDVGFVTDRYGDACFDDFRVIETDSSGIPVLTGSLNFQANAGSGNEWKNVTITFSCKDFQADASINGSSFISDIANNTNYAIGAGNISILFNVSGTAPNSTSVNCIESIEFWEGSSAAGDNNPVSTLNSPVDNFNTSSTTVAFNCSATDDSKLDNISLYGNWSGGWHLNETNTTCSGTSCEVTFNKTITDGTYVWNCEATDNASQTDMANANRTFTVDTIKPTSNSPSDVSYTQDTAQTIDWLLQDNYSPGYYSVERNGSEQNASTTWTNNTNLAIWVNTSTVGNWNYTIIFNDSIGNTGTQDEVIITITAVAGTLTLNYPVQYQIFQRNSTGWANISVFGNYTGTPTNIECQFNNSAWTTLVASPTSNSFSGNCTGSQGQGNLNIRFTNDNSVTDSVSIIGIGDVFVIGGQSNAEGRGTNGQTLSGDINATVYKEDDTYSLSNDPTDSDTASGSIWPLVANLLISNQSVPVMFITTADGGVSILCWQKGQSCYDDMINQVTEATNGTMRVKAMLFFQGETDAKTSVGTQTYEDYKTNLTQMADDFINDMDGVDSVIVGQINIVLSVTTRGSLDDVKRAQKDAWDESNNVSAGPSTYDIGPLSDNLHFKSDAELQEFADRFWASIVEEVYGLGGGHRGPQLTNIKIYSDGINNETITVTFDKSQLLIEDWNGISSSLSKGWRIEDGATNLTDANVTGTTLGDNHINVSFDTNISSSAKVFFGSYTDAYGKNITRDNTTYKLPIEAFFSESLTISVTGAIDSKVYVYNGTAYEEKDIFYDLYCSFGETECSPAYQSATYSFVQVENNGSADGSGVKCKINASIAGITAKVGNSSTYANAVTLSTSFSNIWVETIGQTTNRSIWIWEDWALPTSWDLVEYICEVF